MAQEKVMIFRLLRNSIRHLRNLGEAIFFLGDIFKLILSGQIRWADVLNQMYEQGVQSIVIVMLTSFATGAVLGLQGSITLQRFGAKEFIARLVVLSLLREMSPVFTALIFSGKAGAGITAELGTMNTHDQIQATRVMGVDPIKFLVVPRFLACVLALPALVIISEILGMVGGFVIAITQAHIASAYYIHETMDAVGFVDFFSGFIKVFFFAIIVGWICCYQGFFTQGGATGVGRFTTKAVAYSYIAVILSNTVLTKIILTFWG